MLFLLAALVGLFAGVAAGGSVNNLGAIRFKWPLIPLFALIMRDVGVNTPIAFTPFAPLLYVTGLTALFARALWHRHRVPGIVIVAIGMFLNLIVIGVNFGHMPVSLALADRGPHALIEHGVLGYYVLMSPDTRLDFLGDWIELPPPINRLFSQAYSPGDLLAIVGMGLTLFWSTRRRVLTTR
jgi:hypothetical protein